MRNAVAFVSGIAVMLIHNFAHTHSFCNTHIYCNGWMDIYCAVLYRVGRWHCWWYVWGGELSFLKVLTCNVIFSVRRPSLRTCAHKKHQMYDITSMNWLNNEITNPWQKFTFGVEGGITWFVVNQYLFVPVSGCSSVKFSLWCFFKIYLD